MNSWDVLRLCSSSSDDRDDEKPFILRDFTPKVHVNPLPTFPFNSYKSAAERKRENDETVSRLLRNSFRSEKKSPTVEWDSAIPKYCDPLTAGLISFETSPNRELPVMKMECQRTFDADRLCNGEYTKEGLPIFRL